MKNRSIFFAILLIMISAFSGCNISHLGNSVSSDENFTRHDSSLSTSVAETSANSNSSDDVASSNSSLNTSVPETNENTRNDVYTFSLLQTYQYDPISNLLYNKNGSGWKEIIAGIGSNNIPGNIIGIYKNKLYIYDDKGIFYVDLEDNFKVTRWLDFIEYEHWEGCFENLGISNSAIIGDDLYFTYNSSAGGSHPEDGLLKISMNATSIKDAIQFNNRVEFDDFLYNKDANVIYYRELDSNNYTGSLYKYDVATSERILLLSQIVDFKFYNNKLLYLTKNNDLYTFDVNNGDNEFIYHSPSGNINSGNLWSFAAYLNNSVYYKAGNSIIKHDLNGNTSTIYTYSPSHDGDSFYGFVILDDNIIELVLQSGGYKYIVGGSLQDKLPSSYSSQVKLLDGTVASYANNLFGPTFEYKK